MALKKYQKGNQVYRVAEGSDLEAQLLANEFEEVVEDEKPLNVEKLKLEELKEYAKQQGIDLPSEANTKAEILAVIKQTQED